MRPTQQTAARPGCDVATFFSAAGEMGRRCQGTDWGATPLGPVDDWPQSLRTASSCALGFAFPSMLLWGSDLVQIYNDGYVPFLGARHPRALGRPYRDSWPERMPVMGPIYERIHKGETVSLADQRFTIARNGTDTPAADVTATLSYVPVWEENGSIGGILCTAFNPLADEELRRSESRFRLLVDAVQDYGIFMLDAHGRVASWNHGAERIKGYTADDILGRHFSTFYTEADRARGHPDDELRIAAELGRYEEAGWRVRKDGSSFWANIVITAIRDETGELLGFAKVTRDLTERRKAEQELLEAKRQAEEARKVAEEANGAKGSFLATMSHELRTPLNAIGGYVDLLDLGIHGPQNESQREALTRIRANQRHLMRLINDVLDFVKLEAGHVEIAVRPIAMSELLTSMEPLLAPVAQLKGVAFSVEVDDEPLRLIADPDRVRQILINLVANAVKFTPAGGRVSLTYERDSRDMNILVRDSGPGIPLEQQRTIFEPFFQLNRDLTSAHEGLGLGLPISRDLARAMGGELVVESVPNEGTTFTLRLPAT